MGKTRRHEDPLRDSIEHMTVRLQTLRRAHDTNLKDDRKFGEPADSFASIMRRFNAHLINRFGENAPQLDRRDVALFLIDQQAAGLVTFNSPKLWAKIAAYAAAGAEASEVE